VSRKHGQTTYFVEGEGLIGGEPGHSNGAEGDLVLGPELPEAAPDTTRAFRFSRMFGALARFRPAPEALEELGQAMDDAPNLQDHPTLPAGFTYFGQFLDHDITFDNTEGLLTDELSDEQLKQGRSPSLDLDSLYGLGPQHERKRLYEDDQIHLRIGRTSPVGPPDEPEGQALPNDLPRGDNPDELREASIGDPRNDENLAVAQTHLAFLKFHNRVVDQLATQGYSGALLFEEARRVVTLHYQWIVLHDFVARVIEPEVLQDVLANGRRFYTTRAGEEPSMPLEFSVAAYRFGHSMIRAGYTWNRNFTTELAGSLELLFVFSGGSGDMFGLPTLPSNWPIDWRRFFELEGAPGVEPAPGFNVTRSIDTALALPLKQLPAFVRTGGQPSLAVRNLLRGRMVGLPTGQAVAEAIGAPTLTPAELRTGPHGAILQKHGFDAQTPLWYYILREAEHMHDGQRLGPVGSHILAETFVGLIAASRTSLLADPYWRPSLPSRQPGHFTMADLLLLVGDLNPLGAERDGQPGPRPEPEPEPEPFVHVVQPGESLRMLAQRFLGNEMRWREIFNANRDKISKPDLIRPGMTLLIPLGEQPLPVPRLTHVVREGENLRMLAQRFLGDEMRWPEIFNANRDKISNPDLIHVGVELEIPN
jgi:hypothetical protein